ncbi:MAG: enoyl-CoA hydratase/isomerase family protein [Chloroflexota bacterium]
MEKRYKTILYEKDKATPDIAYITLNRPDKSNAISIGPDQMTGEIQDALKQVNHDTGVKVVIIRGAGKNFCGGFDLAMVYRVYGGAPGVRPPQAARLQTDEEQVMGLPRAILDCSKITISQIHGWCVEAGMFMSESCDISIASRTAKFAHRGQRLAFGGMPLVPLDFCKGHHKKMVELLITGRTISGEEAEQIGIVTRAVEAEILDEEVYHLAKAICLLPRDVIALGKMHRKLTYQTTGMTNLLPHVVFHTLSTNLTYAPDEKEVVFLRDREVIGEKAAFSRLHERFEEALNKTKYFRSYTGD